MYSFPSVSLVPAKRFSWILLTGVIPDIFCESYVVPISKSKDVSNRIANCSDYRGICVSSVIARLFEYCLLNLLDCYFYTSDFQFGFKRGVGCAEAICAIRELICDYISKGDTANLVSIDIAKAFPSVNHDAIVMQWM